MRVLVVFFFNKKKILTYEACRSRPFYRVTHLKKIVFSLVAQMNFLTPMSTKVLHCSENILGAWPGSFFFLRDNLNKSVSSRSTQNHSSSQTTTILQQYLTHAATGIAKLPAQAPRMPQLQWRTFGRLQFWKIFIFLLYPKWLFLYCEQLDTRTWIQVGRTVEIRFIIMK